MYLPAYNTISTNAGYTASAVGACAKSDNIQGLISEVSYNEASPLLTQMLLPLLQQLGQQSRWQLWLTPQSRLSREWARSAGLPLNKMMQLPVMSVEAMAKALRTGNYSVVIGWLTQPLTDEEHNLLSRSAEEGCAIGLIMRPNYSQTSGCRPRNGLKIHSNLYH
ncbi:cell division inhibitor SulA [Enterobacteriaceae bacterium 4M9]|nr:cell division inhibitor SulA [Enterobacteriaceae bacterium 4M9]